MTRVEVHYRRPPDRLQVYSQEVVAETPDVRVTLHESHRIELDVAGRTVLERGAPIVWFVFPGAWYDVGRFHLRDGTFTGYYTDIIVPATFDERRWEICDLFLDVWLDTEGGFAVLDRDEFDAAVDESWIDPDTARRARSELERIVGLVRDRRWPPRVVDEWDLERARRHDG